MKLTLNNKENIEIVKKAAKYCFTDYPVLQELSIVQAILESGLLLPRPSKLALEYCNLFGMKPGKIFSRGTLDPDGIVKMMTTECDKYSCYKIPQPFLANTDIEHSFGQHEQLFRRLPRYKPLFECKTFAQAAQTVRQCGYATDPDYSIKLVNIYHKHVRS
jgi:flagellum-specific peptidoglycan hydrolase FlgJ